MSRTTEKFFVLMFVCGISCVATGAENFRELNPAHPVFSALEVGQFISIRWEQTGCVISDWGGIKKVEAIGPDYLVYSETGMTFYLYINQVILVTVRPGGRIVEPKPLGNSDLDSPDDFFEPTTDLEQKSGSGKPPSGDNQSKEKQEDPPPAEDDEDPFG